LRDPPEIFSGFFAELLLELFSEFLPEFLPKLFLALVKGLLPLLADFLSVNVFSNSFPIPFVSLILMILKIIFSLRLFYILEYIE